MEDALSWCSTSGNKRLSRDRKKFSLLLEKIQQLSFFSQSRVFILCYLFIYFILLVYGKTFKTQAASGKKAGRSPVVTATRSPSNASNITDIIVVLALPHQLIQRRLASRVTIPGCSVMN